ncbi:hypothetical protein [Flavobacterium sp.]|uniref:hypothetical protein n=1 Tax=Flavobacterium sp. TaxID=239 RepID=UPI0039E473D9
MKTVQNRIEEIRRNGYPSDFGVIFNHTFETYKKVAAMAGLSLLIFSFLLCIVFLTVILTSVDWQNQMGNRRQFEQIDITQFSTVGLIGYMTVMILFTALTVPLIAGIIKMCYNAEKNEEISIANAFSYFSGNHFVNLFIAGFVLGTFNTLVSVGFEFLHLGWVGGLIGGIVGVLTILAVPLVIFGNLRPIEAITASITVVSRQFFVILLLLIVCYIIAFCGLLACCVGFFFTLPLVYVLQYSLYVHSVGFEENNDIEDNY